VKRKITNLTIAIGVGLCFGATAQADDLRFTSLPSNVQTTVIHATRIPNASRVTRILRDSGAIYVVTVRDAKGEQVIYVNEAGLIVQAPVSTATVQKSAGTALPAFESSQTVVTYDQVQQNASRYQLLERKGTKEMYRDSRTGQKMTVRLENN
jgi:hypothetical protein